MVKETYGIWERRAPLCPEHVASLVQQGHKVKVQPSSRRIFPNEAYQAAGAELTTDLSDCSLVLGVKQVPVENLLPDRSYMFFSHTIKAQPENMALLDACLEKNIRLFDYECMIAGGKPEPGKSTGRRLVAFGEYAGIVGFVDILQALGQQLLSTGFSTPFVNSPQCYMHPSLDATQRQLADVGREIKERGLPQGLGPLTFTFVGSGNVATGARRMFDLLPHKMVSPEELRSIVEAGETEESRHMLYGTCVDPSHYVRRISDHGYDKEEYYKHPNRYEPIFHETLGPYTSVLVNCMYWDQRYPRLLTSEQLKALAEPDRQQDGPAATSQAERALQLRAVADITCDIDGSVEMLSRATTMEAPFYEWNVFEGRESTHLGEAGNAGVMMLGVDILPTALPREASKHFGDALMPLLTTLLNDGPSSMSPELEYACICADGRLTKSYEYIDRIRGAFQHEEIDASREADQADALTGSQAVLNLDRDHQPSEHEAKSTLFRARPANFDSRLKLFVRGHLFDSGFINQAFDLIERKGGHFEVGDIFVLPNLANSSRMSQVVLLVSAEKQSQIDEIHRTLVSLAEVLETAEAVVEEIMHSPSTQHAASSPSFSSRPQGASPALASPSSDSSAGVGTDTDGAAPAVPAVDVQSARHVLLLGAGLVSAPLVEYLTRPDRASTDRRKVTVVSQFLGEAQEVAAASHHPDLVEARALEVQGEADREALVQLMREADVVVSLLPPPLHPGIAEKCIEAGTHLVTASYVSPGMRALDSRAKDSGIILLNEMGLDPGMDHMSAMQVIDAARAKGGVVTSFRSLCGGLSSPDAFEPDDPLQYKFSWSPAGVFTAAMSPATYLEGGKRVDEDGPLKLSKARPFNGWKAFNLEMIPNRDSIPYADLYDIAGDDLETIYRGTLRFRGWCALVHSFQCLGLLGGDALRDVPHGATWGALLDKQAAAQGYRGASELLMMQLGQQRAEEAISALKWLGITRNAPVHFPGEADGADKSLLNAFVHVLSERLGLQPGEKDLVLMQHQFEFLWPDGSKSGETSSFMAFGTPQTSAMASTVGITAAIGADLVLDGSLDSRRGVVTPMTPDIYEPSLAYLAREGYVFSEEAHSISPAIEPPAVADG